MRAIDRINKLLSKKQREKDWILNSYILCKTFGWDYYMLIRQPIPFVLDMMEAITFEAKQQSETMEKKKTLPSRTGIK